MSSVRTAALRLLLAGSIFVGTAAGASVTYTDSTFDPANYSIGFAASQGGSTFSMSTCASCGNPGSALALTISQPDGSNLGAAVMNSQFTYDPSTQGTIGSISATVDKDFFVTSPTNTYGNSFRLVIEQGGAYYVAAVIPSGLGAGGPGVTTTTGYMSFSLSGLSAADFNEYDTATGLVGTAHPDFASGPIIFGLGQVLAANSDTAGSQVTVTSEFDNLSITVQSVPEPATWAMFIVGFGLIGRTRGRGRIAIGAF